MTCMSCAFILTKLWNYSYIYSVIDSLAEYGSWEASGYCEGLDSDNF